MSVDEWFFRGVVAIGCRRQSLKGAMNHTQWRAGSSMVGLRGVGARRAVKIIRVSNKLTPRAAPEKLAAL